MRKKVLVLLVALVLAANIVYTSPELLACLDLSDKVVIDSSINLTAHSLALKRGNNFVDVVLPVNYHKAYFNVTFEGAVIAEWNEDKFTDWNDCENDNDGTWGALPKACDDDEVDWVLGSNISNFYLETCKHHDGSTLELCYTEECPKMKVDINVRNANTTDMISVGGLFYGSGVWIPLTKDCHVCGNGVKEADEECDDGNLINGDGCDENCKEESIYDFCAQFYCGWSCYMADWKNNEPGIRFPGDCTIVLVEREGQIYPKCVPTVASEGCAD